MTKFLLQGRAIAAGLMLCLSLAACGGGDDSPAVPPDSGNPGEPGPGNPGEPGEPGTPKPEMRCAP